MKKKKNKALLMVKVILTIITLFLFSGVGVMAVTTKVNAVKITLSDGYEMTVLTNKTKVADILEENSILISKDEKVTPRAEKNITEAKTIVITNKSEQEIEVAKVSESGIDLTLESLLKAYDTIVEKIEVKQESIPFETIKKDVSNGAESTKNKVLQEGQTGIKEITYKVKYQNNTEIERTKISEKVIKEPVNKIVQVKSNIVSSRGLEETRTATNTSTSTAKKSSVRIFKITAYCPCSKCCGRYANGITAVGTRATAGRTIAASKQFSFGTKLKINGHIYTVEDRGGAIKGDKIDIYMDTHAQALKWGVKYLPVEVVN